MQVQELAHNHNPDQKKLLEGTLQRKQLARKRTWTCNYLFVLIRTQLSFAARKGTPYRSSGRPKSREIENPPRFSIQKSAQSEPSEIPIPCFAHGNFGNDCYNRSLLSMGICKEQIWRFLTG